MFKSQSLPTSSPPTVTSMQELFDLIERCDFHTSISNCSINPDDELEQEKIQKICTDLKSVEKLTTDQDMSIYPINNNETISSKINCPEDSTSANASDDSQPSLTIINSDSFDNHDIEPIDPKEWLIQDSNKMRPPKLYEFLVLLLNNPRYISYASWINKNEGIFKIHKPIQVAYLWKQVKIRKTNGSTNYDTFARGIRYYYKSGAMIKTHMKHTYCFAKI